MIFIYSITILYALTILLFVYGSYKIPNFDWEENTSGTTFSILIPFRNEAHNLPQLISSLNAVNYPKHLFEIIFIDDQSTDGSSKMVAKAKSTSQFSMKLIFNRNPGSSPKKEALKLGIEYAQHDWILTTDADCIVPQNWLLAYHSMIAKHSSKMIAGPVCYYPPKSFMEEFQVLDFMSLQGITIGAFGIGLPLLCNGANLCYQKALYYELNGFEGNLHLSSGDDIFLLEKATKKYPKQVHYLKAKDAIVFTSAQPSFEELIQQRIRWAKKSSAYRNFINKGLGLVVIGMNITIILCTMLWLFGSLGWTLFLAVWTTKLFVDLLCISITLKFFDQIHYIRSFIISSIIYPFFVIYVVVMMFFSNYTWKQRQYQK